VNKHAGKSAAVVLSLCLFWPNALAAEDACLSLHVSPSANNQIQLQFLGDYRRAYFVEQSQNLQDWVAVATNNDSAIQRVVTLDGGNAQSFYRVSRELPSGITGLSAKIEVSMKGNDITMDAYDSSDLVRFPGGLWNATNAFAECNVSTAGFINLGNARIHGRLLLTTDATYSFGPYGIVGDMPGNWPAQSGLESADWICTGFVFQDTPDVISPYSAGLPPIATGSNYVLEGGNYYLNGNFSTSGLIQVNGVTALYVTGSFNAGSITVSPYASLRLYVGAMSGPASSATLNDIANPGSPAAFQFFGLPTCSAIGISSTNGYRGTIYAPEAALTINIGGINSFTYEGACVVNSFTVNGHFAFHYDRNLSRYLTTCECLNEGTSL